MPTTITINDKATNGVQEFLQACVDAMTKLNNGAAQETLYSFTLQHGRGWNAQALPDDVDLGTPQSCFENAAKLAQYSKRKRELIYCEGYACSVFPVHHAWCVDHKGNVIDNTWADPEKCEYFGVPFKMSYIIRKLCDSGYYGMIDDWESGRQWPLLRGKVDVKDFLHPIRAKALRV